jgi:CRP/FNR family cyclic AMP-dependent transcriptional regulator
MGWHLLADVPDEEVRRLLSVARRRTFAAGEAVFHRDDPADSLHLISKGRFAVRIMSPLGDVTTLAIRGPGESFGEMALVASEARRTATVTALEAAETFCVYETHFHKLRVEHPSVEQVLTAFLVGEIQMLNDRLLDALYLSAEKRVRKRLSELARIYAGEGVETEIALTQEELATLAGTTRRTRNGTPATSCGRSRPTRHPG